MKMHKWTSMMCLSLMAFVLCLAGCKATQLPLKPLEEVDTGTIPGVVTTDEGVTVTAKLLYLNGNTADISTEIPAPTSSRVEFSFSREVQDAASKIKFVKKPDQELEFSFETVDGRLIAKPANKVLDYGSKIEVFYEDKSLGELRVLTFGDINGDKFADLVLGAPRNSTAYLVKGKSDFTGMTNLATADAPKITGNNFLGKGVGHLGDLNADGYSDFIIASGSRFLIYFGQNDLNEIVDEGADVILECGSSFNLSSVVGGDLNEDGYNDVVIGVRHLSGYVGGVVFVIKGKDLLQKGTYNIADKSFATYLGDTNANLGEAVDIGDIDGDGHKDIMMAASRDTEHGSQGTLFVVFGPDFGNRSFDGWPYQFVGKPPFAFVVGESNLDGFASSATVGDINGDDIDDVMIGAPYFNSHLGAVYVYLGGDNFIAKVGAGQYDLRILGTTSGERFGNYVTTVGDAEGDDFDDFVAVAPEFNDVNILIGKMKLFHGADNINSMNSDSITDNRYKLDSLVIASGDVLGNGSMTFVEPSPTYETDPSQNTREGIVLLYLGSVIKATIMGANGDLLGWRGIPTP